MKLLAISLPRHDMSMSYFDGETLKYIKIERLKEEKRYSCWNYQSDRMNLYQWKYEAENAFNINVEEVDEIIFDFHLDTIYGNKIPHSLAEVMNGKTSYCKIPSEHNPFKLFLKNENVYYISHHYAHALSTWMLHPDPDVCITIDGEGDKRTWSVYRDNKFVDGGRIEDGSIGGSMAAMAKKFNIQGSFNDLAGKLMSFVSYGKVDQNFVEILKKYSYRDIDRIFDYELWINYIGDVLLAEHKMLDWGATVNYYIGEVLVRMFKDYAKPNETISYAGGVAQNIVWNTRLKEQFPKLIIPPHSSDEGLSLGAIELLRRKNNLPKFKIDKFPYIQKDIAPNTVVSDELITTVAEYLAQGKIVLWYQDHGEAGPRALGNRSILMDPRIPNGKEKINRVKNRENFRPFGASVLKEHASTISTAQWDDDFMLYTTKLTDDNLHSIKHVDGSCRLQTVALDSPSTLRKLLERFYEMTKCPCLLNTSLNIAGKPIAGYPDVALTMLEDSNHIDIAVIGDKLYKRNNLL